MLNAPTPPPPAALPAVRSHPWHSTAHHRPGGGFRNPWRLDGDDVPALKAAGWLLSYAFKRRAPDAPTPRVNLEGALLAGPIGPGRARVAWLGHTTCLVQFAGANVLTDPVFSRRASPFSFAGPERQVELPLDPDALPPVHVVLLSHDHYDHLDRPSVERLQKRDRPLFVTPLGLGERLRGWLGDGVRVVDLDWWQWIEVHGLRFHAAPARHFSGRSTSDRDHTLWASFFLETDGGPTVYFAGDSGYGPHFAQVHERLGAADLALVPIGAYDPRWFMRRVHMDPEEAVRAFVDTGARRMLATHWGTFVLTEEPLDEPPRRLAAEAARQGLAERVHVLPVGGTLDVRAGT